MIVSTLDLPILQPAFLARMLVAVAHMPLGMQVWRAEVSHWHMASRLGSVCAINGVLQ